MSQELSGCGDRDNGAKIEGNSSDAMAAGSKVKDEIHEAILLLLFADYCKRQTQPSVFVEGFLEGVQDKLKQNARAAFSELSPPARLLFLMLDKDPGETARLLTEEADKEILKAVEETRSKVLMMLALD